MKSYFDTIPHDKLMRCLEMRIADQSILRLIRLWLQTPIEEPPSDRGGKPIRHRPKAGTPQGGVVSPLLANLYLHWLDVLFQREGPGSWANARIIRYADDFVIMARYVGDRIQRWTSELLEGRMGLTLNREKTQIRHVRLNQDPLSFLGYTFRWEVGRYHRRSYLRREPSAGALKRARQQILRRTSSHLCSRPIPTIVLRLNLYLTAWASYFRTGHPQRAFRKLDAYVQARMRLHLHRRSQRPFRCPEGKTLYEHLYSDLGLVRLGALARA
jgi:RNA-directed DNA polymerase